MPTDADRLSAARRRAAELARSGCYRSWTEIEKAVAAEGLKEVHIVFNTPQACKAVDEACRIAQAACTSGVTYEQAVKEGRRG